MKNNLLNIKEKAEEYVFGFHPSIQRMCKESYVDGATYVLDEVEQVVQDNLSSHSTFKLKCIKQIVEELKK